MQKRRYDDEIRLNKMDKAILRALEVVVEGVAKAFGSNCEVVLHCLEDMSHSVVKIANGHVSGRGVGSPLTDFGIEILKKADSLEKDVIGSYYSKLDNGKTLKSVTMLIRNTQGKPIGFLCINIDLSAPLLNVLNEFSPTSGESPLETVIEHFPLTMKDLIGRTLEMVMTEVNNQRKVSPPEKNKMTIMELYKRGVFNVKGAIELVAKEMGVSRYTVYNYLREARFEAEEGM